MNAPTVKTLVDRLGVDRDTAARVRGLLTGDTDPETIPETAAWVRACYHRPHWTDIALHAVDVVLGTFGVEGWSTGYGRGGVSYCNTGETYTPTVVLIHNSRTGARSWAVCSWGSIVEGVHETPDF